MRTSFYQKLLSAPTMVCLIATAAALLMPTLAHAFTYTITSRTEYRQSTAKVVAMAGTFRLAGGERISNVFINMLDSNRRVVSSAQGTIDRKNHTWAGAVGDFRTVYYYAEFWITDPQGGNRRMIKTPVYTWTGQ